MDFIQRILNIEEVNYVSNLNQESLYQEIDKFFKQESLPFVGEISSPNKFSAYDKQVVVNWIMPNLKRKAAYIKGVISKRENGSLIKLTIKPNTILPAFAMFSAFIGLVLCILYVSFNQADKYILLIGLFFISLGIIYYPMSIYLKNRLRNYFVKHINLQKQH